MKKMETMMMVTAWRPSLHPHRRTEKLRSCAMASTPAPTLASTTTSTTSRRFLKYYPDIVITSSS